MASRTTACLTLVASIAGAPALAAQASVPPPAQVRPAVTGSAPALPASGQTSSSDQGDVSVLPVDLERIKAVLDRNTASKVDEPQLRFYLDVLAKQPSFKEFLGSYDLKNGPVKNALMTHQEFLDLVTPREFNHPGGFDMLGAIKKGVAALRDGRDAAEVASVRAQIDRELAALRGGG
jgi:hypothetical protein